MQTLQQELWALEGPRVQWHVGDLAWGLHSEPSQRRLWLDGQRCVAWALLHRPATLDYEVHREHRGDRLHHDVLDWFESEAEGDSLTTYAMEDDDAEDVYRRVTQTWPYRPELDCVLEAPDGTFAAYVLCWYDDANRVGELEPVGTHPDYRREGLGAAVCRYALQRLQQAGAMQVVVYAGGRDEDECARALYESIGFRRHTRATEFRKQRS
jgi:ribosomal protein S18 acetylase RimI-like enzyme